MIFTLEEQLYACNCCINYILDLVLIHLSMCRWPYRWHSKKCWRVGQQRIQSHRGKRCGVQYHHQVCLYSEKQQVGVTVSFFAGQLQNFRVHLGLCPFVPASQEWRHSKFRNLHQPEEIYRAWQQKSIVGYRTSHCIGDGCHRIQQMALELQESAYQT